MRKPLIGFFIFILALPVNAESPTDRSDVWRPIREGVAGYSAVSGQESNVLIQASGSEWLYWRNELLSGVGAWALAGTVLLLGLFFLIRGRIKLSQPRTGELIPRWSRSDRWLHFYTAALFILLALSGIILLYGRGLLIEPLGRQNFAEVAGIAKIIHNYTGPLFIVGLVLMAMRWSRDNLPGRVDLIWFKQFGGMIGDKHPSAGRINAGEKAWFWLLIGVGLVVSVTGLMLDFSNFGQLRQWLQISHILHASGAFILMVGALGHAYIGSIGTEGALEAMTKGRVDASWAKQHHDLWYRDVESEQVITENDSADSSEQVAGHKPINYGG